MSNVNSLSQLGNLSSIDSDMNQAENDMKSTSTSTQLLGQAEMQKVMQRVTSISTYLKNLSDMEQEIIHNSKVNG